MNYLLTIGLEIHIKLKSINKIFCQCKNEQNFDTLLPNTNICPVCTAQPGALPTLSEEVLQKALLLGKALNCKINKVSKFDRKSYFYPDLPMGYQITQLYKPTNVEGKVSFFVDNYQEEKMVHILDAHIESDTGKMIHDGGQALLDFNRAGTPLVEVVTGPDFTETEEVTEFLKELQRIVRYNNIADADMEKGQMRVDVNISLRKKKSDPLGTRVEIKNVNSFGMIRRAIDNEYKRQAEVYDKGESFTQETRGWDDVKGSSYSMRSKEDALDYRYFPEPDLPPLVISNEMMKWLDSQALEISHDIIKNMKEEYGFSKEYINALIGDKRTLDYFLSIFSELKSSILKFIPQVAGEPSSFTKDDKLSPFAKGEVGKAEGFRENNLAKTIVKWIAGPISAWMKENFKSINELLITREQFKGFLQISLKSEIMDNQLKIVMDEMLQTGKSAEDIIKEKGFDTPVLDSGKLEGIIQKVLDENPAIVEQYKGGKTTTLGFFVGQVMKATGGKVNPNDAGKMVEKLLK